MFSGASAARIFELGGDVLEEAPGVLQNLDLVLLRVPVEVELALDRAVLLKLRDVCGLEAGVLEAPMLGLQVVDGDGQVPVAVAEIVGLPYQTTILRPTRPLPRPPNGLDAAPSVPPSRRPGSSAPGPSARRAGSPPPPSSSCRGVRSM